MLRTVLSLSVSPLLSRAAPFQGCKALPAAAHSLIRTPLRAMSSKGEQRPKGMATEGLPKGPDIPDKSQVGGVGPLTIT